MGKVEDEIHVLLICSAYEEIRKQYVSSRYLLNRNQISFNKLMNTQNIENLGPIYTSRLTRTESIRIQSDESTS